MSDQRCFEGGVLKLICEDVCSSTGDTGAVIVERRAKNRHGHKRRRSVTDTLVILPSKSVNNDIVFNGPKMPQALPAPIAPAATIIASSNEMPSSTVDCYDKFWGAGATGQEIALNSCKRRDLVLAVEKVTHNDDICPICERDDVSSAMEPIVLTGSVSDCMTYLRNVAPDLAQLAMVQEHINHGIKDDKSLEKHMLQTLLRQSYSMACKLGNEFGVKITTENSQMCVPNRHNIAGFATASSIFIKILKAKRMFNK